MSNILTLLVTFVIFSFGALATFFYQERCSIYIGTVYRVYADVNVLSTAIELYRKDNKKLPNSLDDLIPEYLREIIPDPWGNDYLYNQMSEAGKRVYSLGADNKIGGKGMDTDIFKNTNVKELVANIKKPLFGCKV